MKIPGLKTAKLFARWLRGRLVGGTLILGYHSISEGVSDASSICVTPQHFAEQLQVLSQIARVISLRELVGSLQEAHVPKRAVVLTFDDGYTDLLHHAKPLLEHHQTPVTVFVTTGSPGCEFWWDELERLSLSSTKMPADLSLQVGTDSYASGRSLSASRQRVVESLYQELLALAPREREKALLHLRAQLELGSEDPPARRALTPEELIELAAGGLVEIGAHTVTHPVLASLPISAQRREIQDSKLHLEMLLGRPVTSFAYPNGSSSQATRALVRESGFDCACASHNDIVWRACDPFHLPRFWIRDWNGDTFSRWLRLWLPA
jgi:peptidoglycan/xylan/chitin deacetylase (PgdA/CDA1 family)